MIKSVNGNGWQKSVQRLTMIIMTPQYSFWNNDTILQKEKRHDIRRNKHRSSFYNQNQEHTQKKENPTLVNYYIWSACLWMCVYRLIDENRNHSTISFQDKWHTYFHYCLKHRNKKKKHAFFSYSKVIIDFNRRYKNVNYDDGDNEKRMPIETDKRLSSVCNPLSK